MNAKMTGLGMAAGLLGTVVAANYVTARFGFVPVGFGLNAAAGTLLIGLALALRDGIQDTLGKRAVVALIAAGTAVSFLVAPPQIAIASAAAFALAELLNFAIYTPLRARAAFGDRRWVVAVAASNVAGAIVDTAVFVGIAFGAAAIAPSMLGQLVGKAWATLAYLIIGKGVSVALPRESMQPTGGESHA